MSVINKRNAVFGYAVLKVLERRRKQRRRSTAKIALYVGPRGRVGRHPGRAHGGARAPSPRRRGEHVDDGRRGEQRASSSERLSRPRSLFRQRESSAGRHRSVGDPPCRRRTRSVRARQARRGSPARARARARRQARVQRGPVRAVPGCPGGDRARRARAQPLSGRRFLAARTRARRAARRAPSRT